MVTKKTITIENDGPEGRAEIAKHLEWYRYNNYSVYVTMTEEREIKKGIFFKKSVMAEEKVSYLVKGYDEVTNEWILENESLSRKEPRKATRVVIQHAEMTVFKPVCGG